MTKDEALKLALGVLERIDCVLSDSHRKLVHQAIDAIESALKETQ